MQRAVVAGPAMSATDLMRAADEFVQAIDALVLAIGTPRVADHRHPSTCSSL